MFIKTGTLEVFTRSDLKKAMNVSIPVSGPDDEWLASNGFARIVFTSQPQIDAAAQRLNGYDIVKNGAQYETQWRVVDRTKEEIEIIVDKKRRAAYEQIDGEGMEAMRAAIDALASFMVADLPQEFVDYMDKIETIKQENPKPAAEVVK